MREWEVLIEGDDPDLDDAWVETLASVLMPYDGVVSIEHAQLSMQLTIRAPEARLAARVALDLWCALTQLARFTSLLVCQVQNVPGVGRVEMSRATTAAAPATA